MAETGTAPPITEKGITNEIKRIRAELNDSGETKVNYKAFGINVTRALITVAGVGVKGGDVKREYIKGTDHMRVYVVETKPKPEPKAKDEDKPKAKPASKDERVKVTSTSET